MFVICAVTVIAVHQSEEMLTNADVRTVTKGHRRRDPAHAPGDACRLRRQRRPAHGPVRDGGSPRSARSPAMLAKGLTSGELDSREPVSRAVLP